MSRVSFFMRVDPVNFVKMGLMGLPKEAIGPEGFNCFSRESVPENQYLLGIFQGVGPYP